MPERAEQNNCCIAIRQASSLQELREQLSLANQSVESWSPEIHEQFWNELNFRLWNLVAGDPTSIAFILKTDLFPQYLKYGGNADTSILKRIRFNRNWLESLPESLRDETICHAMELCRHALLSGNPEGAFGLIGAIGYRDDQVLSELKNRAKENKSRLSDRAIALWGYLGVSNAEREEYLQLLHGRIAEKWNFPLISAASQVGTRLTLEVMLSTWLRPDASSRPQIDEIENATSFVLSSTFSAVGRILDRDSSQDIASRAWNHILSLPEPEGERAISMNADLISRTEASEVIRDLFSRVAGWMSPARYIGYLRLSECVRPAHLAGWDRVEVDSSNSIRLDAEAPSGMVSGAAMGTSEYMQKLEAWNVLMSLGKKEALPSIDEAVAGEVSAFAISSFLELAGTLGLGRMPYKGALVLEGTDLPQSWNDNERLVAYIGAIDSALGVASRKSFSTLLHSKSPSGGVLVRFVEALAIIARRLAESGDRSCIVDLLQFAEIQEVSIRRNGAVAALALLFPKIDLLLPAELDRVSQLSIDTTLEWYFRREILRALISSPNYHIPNGVYVELLQLAEACFSSANKPVGESHLAYDALNVALTRNDPGLRAKCLKHEKLLTDYEDAQTTISILYAHCPEELAEATAAWIRGASATQIAHLLGAIRECRTNCPQLVVESLIERCRRMDKGRLSEPHTLMTLAAVSPVTVSRIDLDQLDHWLPQARELLCSVLNGLILTDPKESFNRAVLLTRLAGDGIFAVRRAAYLAFSACDKQGFEALLRSWSVSSNGSFRRRAAEAFTFTEDSLTFQHLAWDADLRVRETFQRSLDEQRERRLAASYLEEILKVRSSEEVLAKWRYGLALAKVGDDLALERLKERSEEDCPPCVGLWHRRIYKSTKRRWDDVMRKWPEPWFTCRANFAPLEAVIRVKGGDVPVTGYRWWTNPESIGDRQSWGGWIPGTYVPLQEAELVTEGSDPVRITITFTQPPVGPVVFEGDSEMPDGWIP